MVVLPIFYIECLKEESINSYYFKLKVSRLLYSLCFNPKKKNFYKAIAIMKLRFSMKENTKKFGFLDLFHKKRQFCEDKKTQISLSSLRNMVKTKEQEDVLRLIEDETIPSVRDAWIDYFLEITKRTKFKCD